MYLPLLRDECLLHRFSGTHLSLGSGAGRGILTIADPCFTFGLELQGRGALAKAQRLELRTLFNYGRWAKKQEEKRVELI